MDCCTHPKVINHAICPQTQVTLEWFCVFSLFPSQRSFVSRYFWTRIKTLKNYIVDLDSAFLLWFSIFYDFIYRKVTFFFITNMRKKVWLLSKILYCECHFDNFLCSIFWLHLFFFCRINCILIALTVFWCFLGCTEELGILSITVFFPRLVMKSQ